MMKDGRIKVLFGMENIFHIGNKSHNGLLNLLSFVAVSEFLLSSLKYKKK